MECNSLRKNAVFIGKYYRFWLELCEKIEKVDKLGNRYRKMNCSITFSTLIDPTQNLILLRQKLYNNCRAFERPIFDPHNDVMSIYECSIYINVIENYIIPITDKCRCRWDEWNIADSKDLDLIQSVHYNHVERHIKERNRKHNKETECTIC